MKKVESRTGRTPGAGRERTPKEQPAPNRTCLLILGMHRSGTSALARVLNLLGYNLPEKLIGALEGNEAGHWEPENIVLFNDRLLTDMGSAWHDFRSLPPSRLGPEALQKADLQLRDLLTREFGDATHMVLKDPRICRLAPLYFEALRRLDCRVVPLIAFRNPAEVMQSLQRRRSNWPEGFGDSVAALMWLRHVLEAELASRGMARSFSDYGALIRNWQAEIGRIASQAELAFPEPLAETAPLIEEFLRPDLKHESVKLRDISGQPALRGWCMKAHDALKRLVIDPQSATAMAVLDEIRHDFDTAELVLSDMADGDAANIRALSEELDRVRQESRSRLALLEVGNAEQTALRDSAQAAWQRVEGQDAQIAELNAELGRLNAQHQDMLQTLAQERAQLDQTRQRAEEQAREAEDLKTRASWQEQQLAELRAAWDQERAEAAKTLHDTRELLGWHQRKVAEMNDLLHKRNVEYDKLQLLSQHRVDEFYKSRSWRVTAPMRAVTTKLRDMRFALNVFRRASNNKGGLLSGSGAVAQILVKEGPRGISNRLANHRFLTQGTPHATGKADPRACHIAATPHVMSLAQMMARVLREEGYLVTVGTDLEGAAQAMHVFVICPQMFSDIPEHYVAVQMEQSVSSRWFTESYFDSLRSARAVIDYSMTNLDFLAQHDLPLYKLHYVPLDVDRDLLPASDTPREGILFYGDDKCPRRQKILSAVAKAYPQLRIINNLFGEDMDRELRRAAVVLNVHYYEGSLLETTRVYQALSHGTPVVSEVSVDQDEHDALDGIVEFAPVDDIDRIIELLRPYAENDLHARAQRQRIRDFTARRDNRFEMFFRRFLLAQNMVGYDAMVARAPDYPMPVPQPAHLCLSLPETPRRRALFAQQGRHGFTIWDGLKATPGWIGAALSYRHLFQRITQSGAQRAIICEDDVLFPEDFDERLDVIERYLEQHDWDLFSGFIADAHEELEVTAVEDFEGVRFVHVNRAVSMVFNIYNRGIMEYLAKWDASDKDVYRNTIDRYLERREGNKVILTLPFLVGHRPDTTSTIWGFENTQYEAVIAKSEIRLAEKVEEFLGRAETGGSMQAVTGIKEG